MTGASESDVADVQERAVRYFCDRPGNFPTGRPYNCCESVLLALKELVGEDAEFFPRVGTAIGTGVSLNGLLCGSVSSVGMLIGLKYGRSDSEQSPEPVWRMMDEYVQAFKEQFGHLSCRQLTGLNLKTPEGLQQYFARVHDFECTERIRFAVAKGVETLQG